MRWTHRPNTSADNSDPEDIEVCIHAVQAVADSCWNQPHSFSSSVNYVKNCLRMICTSFTINSFVKKTQVQQSFLHLQHTRHKLSLHGVGPHGIDVDSVNSSGDYFAYLWIPACETMLPQKIMSIADQFHLWQQIIETNCKNEPC
jgi:hypothetical protein